MQEKSRNNIIQASESTAVMILITLSGGLQDAYTYLMRNHVFANGQTGNIVLLFGSLFSGDLKRAFSYVIPVLSYAFGILIAAILRHRMKEESGVLHWRHLIVAFELLLLTIVAFIPSELSPIANAMVSFSCAMQVETFKKVRGYAYASTMCIGNLKSCMENLSEYINEKDRKNLSKAGYYAFVIMTFGLGAGLGAVLCSIFSLYAILFSSLLLAIAFILMLRIKK